MDASRAVHAADLIGAVVVAGLFIAVMSAVPEPDRRRFNAVLVAGAGAAYLGAGFGPWELVYTTLATFVAWRGLEDVRAVGVAWLMHVVWDIAHHAWGQPILPFIPTSSAGCAVCDAVIAGWFLGGAPSVWDAWRVARARLSRA